MVSTDRYVIFTCETSEVIHHHILHFLRISLAQKNSKVFWKITNNSREVCVRCQLHECFLLQQHGDDLCTVAAAVVDAATAAPISFVMLPSCGGILRVCQWLLSYLFTLCVCMYIKRMCMGNLILQVSKWYPVV